MSAGMCVGRCVVWLLVAGVWAAGAPGDEPPVVPPRGEPARAGEAGGIFVAAPRGAGETLDDAPQSSQDARETVHTLAGSTLTGRVLAIGQDGTLRLADEQFDGEVRVRVQSLDRVSLLATDQSTGRDTLRVSNGDSLFGQIGRISDDEIMIQTSAAGALRVGRSVARSAHFCQEGGLILDSPFARGVMEPWKPVSGDWKVQDGHLVCTSSDDWHVIAVRVDQREAITVEASVEAMSIDEPCFSLAVFADKPTGGSWGENSVYATFDDDDDLYDLGYCEEGDTNDVLSHDEDPSARKAVIRLTYDPATGKAGYWHNAKLMGEARIPQKFTTGKYVLFNTYYPCKVKYIRIAGGLLGSSLGGDQEKTDASVAHFTNNDSVVIRGVALENAAFTFQTDTFGRVSTPAEKVRGILFARKRIELPRRQAGDVVVETVIGRLTLKLGSMDEQWLTGSSDYLGEVKIRRSSIRSIRFNIYQ